eukprot:5964556-Pleurochrysis_carterae.AAC.1
MGRFLSTLHVLFVHKGLDLCARGCVRQRICATIMRRDEVISHLMPAYPLALYSAHNCISLRLSIAQGHVQTWANLHTAAKTGILAFRLSV